MAAVTAAAPAARRPARFEPAAFIGVWTREVAIFRRLWISSTFSAVVEPTIYLLAFGFGIGALISTVGGYSYLEFIGTGSVATAVIFSSVFAGMFTTFVRRVFQKSYDAMLAAPVDVPELVVAEALWIAAKTGVYGCFPLLVAMAFGLPPSWGMLAVPFIAFLSGLGFAFMGQWMSGIVSSINSFSYITSAVITPLFLVAGTFFPITGLPQWAQTLAQLNPLYHCVELVRNAVFGWEPLADLFHLLYLTGFAGLCGWLAVRTLRKRLIG